MRKEVRIAGFGGGVLASIEMQKHRPQMATVCPGVFQAVPDNHKQSGQLTRFLIEIGERLIQTKIVEQIKGRGVDLTQAQVLVAGGRGVDGNFEMLEELECSFDGTIAFRTLFASEACHGGGLGVFIK